MTDHYDESGGKARYMEEQRVKEALTDAARRKVIPVSVANGERANDMREAITQVNLLISERPGVFELSVHPESGKLMAQMKVKL
jgi:hypothetical protein